MPNDDGWTDGERRGYTLWKAWRQYWQECRGYCGEFRGLDDEQIRSSKQFEVFCEVAEWLSENGRSVGFSSTSWRSYLEFVCDAVTKQSRRPFLRCLKNRRLFRLYNSGAHISPEHVNTIPNRELFLTYRRRLHPSLRSSEFMRVLGFGDLLGGDT